MVPFFSDVMRWVTHSTEVSPPDLCPTRDAFQGRLDSLYRALLKTDDDRGAIALLTAAVGEIGNNCFDHNLGKWRDQAGCWFRYAEKQAIHWLAIADRGQGILGSLHSILPELHSHQEALETAFHKQISGRAPEQRGNGLKFVRSVINGHPSRGLCCLSGDGRIAFGGLTSALTQYVGASQAPDDIPGTCVLLAWRRDHANRPR
ncbi:MAG: hypothetical protein HY543_06565 [Deltaproteobacteria bacterium]|nr:hypothetical protein [Deltaproteobacteria bacterium]